MATSASLSNVEPEAFAGAIVEDGLTDQEFLDTVGLMDMLMAEGDYHPILLRLWRYYGFNIDDFPSSGVSSKIPDEGDMAKMGTIARIHACADAMNNQGAQEDKGDKGDVGKDNERYGQNHDSFEQPTLKDIGSQLLADNTAKEIVHSAQNGQGFNGGAQWYNEVESSGWNSIANPSDLNTLDNLNSDHISKSEEANTAGLSEKENEPTLSTTQDIQTVQGKVDISAGLNTTQMQAGALNDNVAIIGTDISNGNEISANSNTAADSHEPTSESPSPATAPPLFPQNVVIDFTGPSDATAKATSRSKTTKTRKPGAQKQATGLPKRQQYGQLLEWTAPYQGIPAPPISPSAVPAQAAASSSTSGATTPAREVDTPSHGLATPAGQATPRPDFFQEWKKLMQTSKAKRQPDIDLGQHKYIICGVATHSEIMEFGSGKDIQKLSISVKCGAKLLRDKQSIVEHVYTVHADRLDSTPRFMKNRCPWGSSCGHPCGLVKLSQHIMEVHVATNGSGRFCESLKCRLLAEGSGDFCTSRVVSACTRTLAWANVEEEEVSGEKANGTADVKKEEVGEERATKRARLA